MLLTALRATLSGDDAETFLRKALDGTAALQNLRVTPADGALLISGNITYGLSVPFETRWHAATSATPNELVITLDRLEARVMGMGGDALAEPLMKLLSSKLADLPGVTIQGRRILVATQTLLPRFGVTLAGTLTAVDLTPAGIALTIQ